MLGSTALEYLSKIPFEEGCNATEWLVNVVVGQRLPFLGLDRWKQELWEEEENVVDASDSGISSNEVSSSWNPSRDAFVVGTEAMENEIVREFNGRES